MEVHPVSVQVANEVLDGRHYLGPVGYQPSHCLMDESQQALAVYSPPVASAFKTSIRGALELARLFKYPVASFQTSQFLSATLRWLKANTKTPLVFSYADPAARHSETGEPHQGTVYRATGFTCLGASRATDVWSTESGERVSSPQAYRMFKTKAPDKIRAALLNPMLVPDEPVDYRSRAIAGIEKYGVQWTLIPGVPKILYVFPLRMRLPAIRKRFETMGSRYAKSLQPVEGDADGTTIRSAVQPREAAPSPATSPAE